MKLEFKPEDFTKLVTGETDTLHRACSIRANAKLAEWLKDAKVVYGINPMKCPDVWAETQSRKDTHRALLINVEELPKESCIHKAFGDTYRGFKCAKCGVPLQPSEWKEVTR